MPIDDQLPSALPTTGIDRRSMLGIAFALMVVIPLLTCGYFLTSYVLPSIVTRESVILVMTLNIILAFCGFTLLIREITRRTRQAGESEEKWRSLVQNAPSLIFISDRAGKILFINRTVSGVAVENVTGKTVYDFIDPEHHEMVRRTTDNVFQTGKIAAYQLEGTGPDNTRAWYETMIGPIERDGQTVAATHISTDITQRKKAEIELRKTNIELSDALTKLKEAQEHVIRQERLSALGQMAGGISHDFNNSLMPVVGLSDFLLSNPDVLDDKDDLVAMLKDIHAAAVDARQVVRRVREFWASDHTLEVEGTDINDIINQTVSLTRSRWKEEMSANGIIISVEKKLGDIPHVNANASQLREALTNIIFNSVDAMPTGGTITIESDADDWWVCIHVTDTGTGMTRDTWRHCLEPFFSTKIGHGAGIGLSMVHGIIARHGGDTEIESEEGKGTTVTVRLPLTADNVTTPHNKLEPAEPSPVSPLNILVIEDDPGSRRLLRRLLTADNHTIRIAEQGQPGIDAFQQAHDQAGAGHAPAFDLVITDRALPDMSGDNVANEIKRTDPDIAIIMLTGFGDIMRQKGIKPPGVDIVVAKPVDTNELRQAIANAQNLGSD